MKRKYRGLSKTVKGADRMNNDEELSFRLALREQAFGDIEQAIKEATAREGRKVRAPRSRGKSKK
jgi:hypothetical protein